MSVVPKSSTIPFQGDLSELIQYAYEKAPYFRSLLQNHKIDPGQVRTPGDLIKIPVTRKDDLIRLQAAHPPFAGWLASDLKTLRRVFFSPGPIADPEGAGEDFWHFEKALRLAGFVAGDVVQNTFSYHMTPGGFMLDAGLQKLKCVVFPSGVGNTELQVHAARFFGVTGYVGTPSFLRAILKKAEEMGIDPSADLNYRKALVTGEPLPPTLRQEFQEKYGIRVFQVYATADIGCAGFECPVQEGWHISDNVIVQICDPVTGEELPPGETGEIVVTHFNPVYPLIRFGTGDLSSFMGEPCTCGDPSPRLSGYKGRVGEGIKVKGMFVHPVQVQAVVQKYPEVEAFQIVVTRKGHVDHLLYRLKTAHPDTIVPERTQEIAESLRLAAKVRGEVEWVPEFEIPDRRVIDLRKWE